MESLGNISYGKSRFGSIEYSIGEIYVVEIESEKEPERQEDYLSVFAIPNPVNDRVQLVGTLELSGKELIIKDVFGRTVARIMMNENMSFVFPQMSSGIYFIVSSIQEFQPIRVIKE